MQKNECVYGTPLVKKEFVDIINRIRESTELVDKVEELFCNSRENVESDFCTYNRVDIGQSGNWKFYESFVWKKGLDFLLQYDIILISNRYYFEKITCHARSHEEE